MQRFKSLFVSSECLTLHELQSPDDGGPDAEAPTLRGVIRGLLSALVLLVSVNVTLTHPESELTPEKVKEEEILFSPSLNTNFDPKQF